MSITDEPDGGEDTSEAEAVEVIEDLGIGFGGEVVARDTLSLGLAPLDGKVRLKKKILGQNVDILGFFCVSDFT